MFAGHVGVGLAIAGSAPRTNAGVFVSAALLTDLPLWAFVLLGWESVTLPADMARTHQARFVFPLSHGLVASVLWSMLGGCIAYSLQEARGASKRGVAFLVAVAIFSHWILDALVHRPEMPLVGRASPAVGLALWDHLPMALLVESALLLLGLAFFMRASRGRFLWGSTALAILSLAILALTVAGMTITPPPPSASAMALGSLVTLSVVCALSFWFGRHVSRDRA
jgi:hypothetical protein